jgi:glycosyltransferase involved in cell wall biosynthesis
MKILFVIHDAGRTGAPLFMLGLLEWLKREHKNIEIDILLPGRGELETDFANTGKVYYWNSVSASICRRVFNKIYPAFHSRWVMFRLKQNNYDLCYVNSVASCSVMAFLAPVLNCPFLLHVHELETQFIISGSVDSFKACVPYARHFIGVSNAVKRNLVENYRIPEDKISVIPPVSRAISNNIKERIDLKKMLNLPADAFIAGICGPLCWHKGMDLLVPLIKKVSASNSNNKVFFVWAGEPHDSKYQAILENDLKKLGLADRVRFVGKTKNISGCMAEFNVLLLLSREESFSLVAAEASALGKTVICFENVVGWTEYASPDAYRTVPYLNLDEMANVIIETSRDPQIHPDGDTNQSNYAAEKVLHELFNLIKNCTG